MGKHPAPLLLAILVAVLFVPPLFTRDPWNPDEPRYAEVAREMVAMGHYLVPHLNGEPYSDKPPLFFWLAAVFWHLGAGVNSGRLVAILANVGTVLLAYRIARRWLGERGGLLAAAITTTTVLFLHIGKFGVLDPLLTFFTTAAIACGLNALDRQRDPRWWLGFYLAAALGVLTKGPVGLCVPGVVLLVYGIARRGAIRKGGWWHLGGAALMLGVVAAWLVPAVLTGGEDYARDILVRQTARRIARSDSHRQPVYFYLANAPLLFFPWSFVLVLAVIDAVRSARRHGEEAAALAAGWFLAVFVFFTIFSGKRTRYLMPLVPAVGLLCARHFMGVALGKEWAARWHSWLWRLTLALAAVLAVVLATSALWPAPLARRVEDDPAVVAEVVGAIGPALKVGAVAGAVAVVAGCLYAAGLSRSRELRRAGVVVGVVVVLSLMLDLGATPLINRFKSGRDLVEKAGAYLSEAEKVCLYASDFSGVYNLFTGRLHMPILEDRAALASALASRERVSVIAKERALRGFVQELPGRVVTRERVGHSVMVVLANWRAGPPPSVP